MKYFYGFCIAVVVLSVLFVVFGLATQCPNIAVYHSIFKGCTFSLGGY